MIGNPKYKVGDIVNFQYYAQDGLIEKTGAVAIVDKYGTFFDNSDVSYDIYVKEDRCLYKHISEPHVKDKIGEKDPNKIVDD